MKAFDIINNIKQEKSIVEEIKDIRNFINDMMDDSEDLRSDDYYQGYYMACGLIKDEIEDLLNKLRGDK